MLVWAQQGTNSLRLNMDLFLWSSSEKGLQPPQQLPLKGPQPEEELSD